MGKPPPRTGGGGRAHLLPTPGHAALDDPEAGLLFGGDLFLEGKREEARGLTPKEVLRRLFGGESPLALLSGGEMSRLAFVEALMMEP